MLNGLFTNYDIHACMTGFQLFGSKSWRVPHVGQEMLTLSVNSFVSFRDCLRMLTDEWLCLPGLVWLLCLGLILLPYDDDDNIGYHSQYYSHYISVSSRNKLRSPRNHLLRSHDDHTHSPISTGILPKLCLLCAQAVKRIGKGRRESLGDCETLGSDHSIRKAAITLHDVLMHTKLAGIYLIAKKVHVKYHHSCESSYIQRVKILEKQSSAMKDEKSRLHSEAYEKLIYVTNTLIWKWCRAVSITLFQIYHSSGQIRF